MSKRCELQKEYYKANGNYKGSGKYSDDYVMWLENEVLALRIHDVVGRSESFVCGHPPKQTYLLNGTYHCEKCGSKWESLANE